MEVGRLDENKTQTVRVKSRNACTLSGPNAICPVENSDK
jgi:hypothetical protein